MENKKLARVFDQVKLSQEREEAMLADLLRVEKEAANMRNTEHKRHRVPAAALVAAALAVVLAGTALAEGYFGRLDVTPVNGDYQNGYNVRGAYQNIPPERLSANLLERAAAAGVRDEELTFSSWAEAEEFIGLEIGGNPVLEEMAQSKWEPPHAEGEHRHEGDLMPEDMGQCRVHLNYSLGLPDVIWMYTQYWGGDFEECNSGLLVSAYMRVKGEGREDMSFSLGNSGSQTELEKYVTPGGMEAAIFTGGYDVVYQSGTSYWQPCYSVYFTLHDAMFWMRAEFNEENAGTVLNGLKKVLDAFE